MKRGHPGRRLINIKLTKRHHLPYMGLWVLLGSSLVVAFNSMVFLNVESQLGQHLAANTAMQEEYLRDRQVFIMALVAVTIIAIAALVFLASLTAHRVAGPYIRLRHVFDAVAEGNMQQKLKFREDDRLEDVESAFNRMMTALRERCTNDDLGET